MAEPYFSQDGITLFHGDVLAVLAELPAESVSCVVTSPPFWGLRKYDCPPSIWGGSPECDHHLEAGPIEGESYEGRRKWQHDGVSRQETPEAWVNHGGVTFTPQQDNSGGVAHGALGTRGQQPFGKGTSGTASLGATCARCGAWRGWLGLEPTVAMYIEHTIEWLRAVWRVMRKDGVLWLDIDDSRSSGGSGHDGVSNLDGGHSQGGHRTAPVKNLPPKSLCLIPQRIAIAAQDDGWIVRSEIIIPTWMPESAQDRPTDACRKVLMLCKSPKYWYDAQAVRVPISQDNHSQQYLSADNYLKQRGRRGVFTHTKQEDLYHAAADGLRNLGSVWDDLPPSSSAAPGKHFATFPVEEPLRCIRASCPPDGLCLDPFMGTGTTAIAARMLGRRCIGIDASEEYLRQAVRRLQVGDAGVRKMIAAEKDGAQQTMMWEE